MTLVLNLEDLSGEIYSLKSEFEIEQFLNSEIEYWKEKKNLFSEKKVPLTTKLNNSSGRLEQVLTATQNIIPLCVRTIHSPRKTKLQKMR